MCRGCCECVSDSDTQSRTDTRHVNSSIGRQWGGAHQHIYLVSNDRQASSHQPPLAQHTSAPSIQHLQGLTCLLHCRAASSAPLRTSASQAHSAAICLSSFTTSEGWRQRIRRPRTSSYLHVVGRGVGGSVLCEGETCMVYM